MALWAKCACIREQAFGIRQEKLDAEAEVYVFLVAGVGVEVVGRAVAELIAESEFPAYEEAQSYGAEAGGDPADGLEEGRFLLFSWGIFGEGDGEILGVFAEATVAGTKLHIEDDSAGLPKMAEDY